MVHFFNVGNGDAILIEHNSLNGRKHILIDGGSKRNTLIYNKFKKGVLDVIDKGDKGTLDIVIVTHSDNDHIGGIINIVGDEELEERVNSYVFHSEEMIAQYLKRIYQKRENYLVKTNNRSTTKSSLKQDKKLTKLLKEKPNKWNKKIYIEGDIMNLDDIKLRILSPNLCKLDILQKHWEKEEKKLHPQSSTVKSSSKQNSDHHIPFKDFTLNEFTEDSSPTNGASIALIYDSPECKGLLLADAHPNLLENSLKELLQNNETKHFFDFVKLAHHGSKNNLTKELLKLIDCHHFIISANADSIHWHPDKETLALIISHYGEENVHFYFTNENRQLKEIFKGESFRNYHFPREATNKITIPYEN